ncbi:SDR family NAD(P)-dependent oxidoreductase [Aquimarina algiphila]|uniref:SDR family NAD(P)-dependent oxidoreductase n=1 Tax=Aquimarina algiphila TaxID=2047982 RepID=A0A554VIQ4_9FLAO|nr:SDR family NAD(P)-dependent oxidoreductase [Aquimarina algiphila]TSE07719.1 SDR family NAD(P)-dependent oxidoreductase [Aquimarina algiphila]
MNIENKIVWITGSSSGIGKALAFEFINAGANVILSARREEELKKVAKNSKSRRKNILILPFDLENIEDFPDKVEKVVQKFGRIDILINNAGIGHRTKTLDTPNEIERKIMEVNFFGTINLTKLVAKKMQLKKKGKIVVISSILGKLGFPFHSTYSASKFALQGYFESLRMELYKDNIHILIVSPGFINTGIGERLITESGEVQGNPTGEERQFGMATDRCAKEVIRAIKKDVDHKFVGGPEISWVFKRQFFPKRFFKNIRKAFKLE